MRESKTFSMTDIFDVVDGQLQLKENVGYNPEDLQYLEKIQKEMLEKCDGYITAEKLQKISDEVGDINGAVKYEPDWDYMGNYIKMIERDVARDMGIGRLADMLLPWWLQDGNPFEGYPGIKETRQ